MDILQDAPGIVWRDDPQVFLHFGIPGLRQILDGDRSFHHADLELQAQHDVQVVGGLIGLDADERRLRPC